MAKRFGRNQRRQFREQVANLEQTAALERRRANSVERRFSSMFDLASRIDSIHPAESPFRSNLYEVGCTNHELEAFRAGGWKAMQFQRMLPEYGVEPDPFVDTATKILHAHLLTVEGEPYDDKNILFTLRSSQGEKCSLVIALETAQELMKTRSGRQIIIEQLTTVLTFRDDGRTKSW